MLTRREQQILEMVARGLTRAQMAQLLVVSCKTVDYHMGNLLQKFTASNQAELISLAVHHRLIDATMWPPAVTPPDAWRPLRHPASG